MNCHCCDGYVCTIRYSQFAHVSCKVNTIHTSAQDSSLGHVWTNCTHRECSTSMQVESCESKLHGCLTVTRSFDTIGAEMCRNIMSASGAGNVTSQCTNVYMCNRAWMEVATFDYREHVVLKEIESSCHCPRHADTHFYDSAWLWLPLFWHWLVHQGGPVVRAQTQVQHDKQETRKRFLQDCQIGRIWNLTRYYSNRYQWILPYTNLEATPCDGVSYVRYSSNVNRVLPKIQLHFGQNQWRLS